MCCHSPVLCRTAHYRTHGLNTASLNSIYSVRTYIHVTRDSIQSVLCFFCRITHWTMVLCDRAQLSIGVAVYRLGDARTVP